MDKQKIAGTKKIMTQIIKYVLFQVRKMLDSELSNKPKNGNINCGQ